VACQGGAALALGFEMKPLRGKREERRVPGLHNARII
jgi:hypothetical protein